MLIRPSVSLVILLALGGAACAKSDPIGGFGGQGSGGWDPIEDDTGAEAGPEVGAGAGTSQGGASAGGGEGGGPPTATSGSSGSTGSGELCGDGTCQIDVESCETCPGDCGGPCAGSCGDGACDAGETCDDCAADCGPCAECGDGSCDAPGEGCDDCPEDCGPCPCEPDELEPNGSSGTASPLALNVEVTGLSICDGDVDWLAFPLSGTRTVTIRFSHAFGDLDLEIYSSITASYVTGSYSESDDESVVLTGLPSGTYWARVYGADGASNSSYAIEVED